MLSYIQVLSDKSDIFGEYILTVSHQSKLNEGITQSLAGRTAILKLLPFSINELLNTNDLPWEEYAFNGFMPRIYDKKIKVTRFYSNYFQTYIERDLKTITNIKNLSSFNTFIKLLAGRIGQVINLSSLSNDVGVSAVTLKEWLSILEASFIIYKLHPYHENTRKQLIKSPKLFFYDTGLLCYLLGINSSSQVLRDPLRGNIFENMVVIDILKYIYNTGSFSSVFFTQDKHKNEVDLIIKQGNNLIPIEIKSSQTYNRSFIKNIEYFMKNKDRNIKTGFVIYTGDLEPKINNISFMNYKKIEKIPL